MQTYEPHFLSLCDKVVLIAWSLPGPVEGPATLVGTFGEAVTPLSCLKLGEDNSNTRIIWAFLRPDEDNCTLMAAAGGASSTPVKYTASATPIVSESLFEGLTGAAKLSLASALLSSWTSLFQLQRNKSFVRVLRTLLKVPEGGRVQPVMAAGDAIIIEAAVPAKFGTLKSGHIISSDSIRPLKLKPMAVRPEDRARNIRRFFCERPQGDQTQLLLLRGVNGFVVRDWAIAEGAPSPESWWRKGGNREPGLRQECIELFNAHSPVAQAASIEFQLRCPLKPKSVAGSPVLPSAQIELALSGPSGILVGGWYRDPSQFLEGFDVLGHDDVPHSLDSTRIEFAGKVAGPDASALSATGFIGFAPHVTGRILQPRFLMRLKSGVRHLLTPQVQPLDWTGARAAALRSIPPQALNDHVIATCLAPVLAEYQKSAQDSIGAPSVKQIGPVIEKPLVSIVIPLYKVLDFLPFQIAAFASDPQIMFRCELIYVLDSPEQADVVEHLLTGLHLVYGISITLAIMASNGGYAIANNRAATLARGDVLALVNSDVIPIEAGWLGELAKRLGVANVGAVGPKLLFEDDSIQHAGLYFSRDHRGRWLNHHYYKGMPRHYHPANLERSVPGITGACVVMWRSLFESVGGFTEDYVIGDYEDSDLCLKLRAAGRDITYVPSAELYHLERRSMTQSADYMRGVASQYNSWLHEQRWDGAMTAIMTETAAPAPQTKRVA